MSSSKPAYGGQAVVEGIMFAGKHTTITTIRRKDGSYDFLEVQKESKPFVQLLKKIPFLRGIIGIIEANSIGTRHFNFATERYNVDPIHDDFIVPIEKSSKLTMFFGVAIGGFLSLIIGIIIFTALPAIIAESFRFFIPGHVAQNLLEGFIKLSFLIIYVYFISLTPFIRRVFQYHGAEHKVINAYERDLPLTVDQVQHQSRLHYRCGTSFILFTIFVGVLFFLMVPFDNIWERLYHRVVFLPVVFGISYEILQITTKFREVPILRWLGYPGLLLQLLTTREPTNDQVAVAITSLNKMLEREKILQNDLCKAKEIV